METSLRHAVGAKPCIEKSGKQLIARVTMDPHTPVTTLKLVHELGQSAPLVLRIHHLDDTTIRHRLDLSHHGRLGSHAAANGGMNGGTKGRSTGLWESRDQRALVMQIYSSPTLYCTRTDRTSVPEGWLTTIW